MEFQCEWCDETIVVPEGDIAGGPTILTDAVEHDCEARPYERDEDEREGVR